MNGQVSGQCLYTIRYSHNKGDIYVGIITIHVH